MEKELLDHWAARWPEHDMGLLRELAARVAKALGRGDSPEPVDHLRFHLKRQALNERPPREAWGFLWALEQSGRRWWPGDVNDWLAVWPPIIDQAAEDYLQAVNELNRLKLQEETRGLRLFLQRAGFSPESLTLLNQNAPLCRPPEIRNAADDE